MKKSITFFYINILISSCLFSQNNCLNFDGINDHVEVQNSASMILTSQLTMEAWVKPNNSNGLQIILNKEGEYEIGIHDGEFVFAIANDWVFKYTGFSVPNNTWSHLSVTYDGNSYEAYANGLLVYSESSTGVIGDIVLDQNEFWIGWRQALFNLRFSGEIDEVRIWNKALTSSQINDLYNDEFSDPSAPSSCLVAYYQLNEVSGSTASDGSENGNIGTLINMTNSDWVNSGANTSTQTAPSCSALPINLVEFEVIRIRNKISLTWITESEINNDGFEILKSDDNTNWQSIGFVQSSDNSNIVNEYQYYDISPFEGKNFYRLQQIDYDGTINYSDILLLHFEQFELTINVYPNPSHRFINIQLENPGYQITKLQLIDEVGIVLWEDECESEISRIQKRIEIENSGIYVFVVQINNDVFSQRVIILN